MNVIDMSKVAALVYNAIFRPKTFDSHLQFARYAAGSGYTKTPLVMHQAISAPRFGHCRIGKIKIKDWSAKLPKHRERKVYDSIASLVTARLYDFEAGVLVVTQNRDVRRCAVRRIRLKAAA